MIGDAINCRKIIRVVGVILKYCFKIKSAAFTNFRFLVQIHPIGSTCYLLTPSAHKIEMETLEILNTTITA